MKRSEIINAIRETAATNDGKPLGRERFVRLTGVTEYDIGRYWARWGDAVREAGLEPNTLNRRFDDDDLLETYVELVAKLGHVPTNREFRLQRESDPTFPNAKVFQRLGSKAALIDRAVTHCIERGNRSEALDILSRARKESSVAPDTGEVLVPSAYGFVYLAKGHRGEYKIGRTNLVDRRLGELGAMAPVEYRLVHEIKTDDPAGVESYWHRRFADKHMRGEWFRLTAADVRAFKRWKRLY
ncbi:MAG: GIY-YIG nuclease family protein [Gaiellaceae bacterium]